MPCRALSNLQTHSHPKHRQAASGQVLIIVLACPHRALRHLQTRPPPPKRGQAASGQDNGKSVKISLRVCSPVDVRRRASPALAANTVASLSYTLANAADFLLTNETVAECTSDPVRPPQKAEFVNLAKKCHADLHQGLDQGKFWFVAWAVDAAPLCMLKAGVPAEIDNDDKTLFELGLGNLGALDESGITEGAELRNLAAHFNSGPGLYVAIATTRSGGISLGVTGSKLSVDRRRRFGQAMASALRTVAEH